MDGPCTLQPVTGITGDTLQEYRARRADPAAAASYLSGVCSLPEYVHDPRSAVQIDYLTDVLDYALDQQLSPEQAAALLQTSQSLLQQVCSSAAPSASSPAADTQPRDQVQRALLQQTATAPGDAASGKFALEQLGSLAAFFAQGLLQHQSLYRYMFQQQQAHQEQQLQLMVETSALPKPLAAALPEAGWQQKQEEQAAAAVAAAAAAEEAARAAAEAQRAADKAAAAAAEASERQAQLEKKPKTLDEAIEKLVAVRVEEERAALAAAYTSKEERLLERIRALEGPGGPGAGAKPGSAAVKK